MELETVLKQATIINRKDNIALLECFKQYIDVLIDVGNSLDGQKIVLYKKKIEILLLKYFMAVKSSVTLLEGTKINSKHFHTQASLIDLPSLHLLTRSIIENYLTIFYLFIQEKDNEKVVEYRNYIYEMSSLCKRQDLEALTPDRKQKKNKEANDILLLRTLIQNNPEFQKLDPSIQKRVLNSPNHKVPAKVLSWGQLFDASKLNSHIFKESWSFYSNYAHSEYLSVLQLHDIQKNIGTRNSFIFQAMQRQVELTAVLILELTTLFSSMKKTYEKQTEKIKNEISFWNMVAQGTKAP